MRSSGLLEDNVVDGPRLTIDRRDRRPPTADRRPKTEDYAMSTTARSLVAEFAADVERDLALVPKQLQSKYLYDPLGSSLFDAICRLPWYRITRSR